MHKWITLTLFPIAQLVQAQTKEDLYKKKMMDSVIMARVTEISKAYPMLRQMSVSHDLVLQRSSNTDYNKQKIFDSKLLTNRTRANINLPIYATRNDVFKLSLNYQHQSQQYNDVRPVAGLVTSLTGDKELSTDTYGFSLGYSRTDSLFHIPVLYSVNVTGVTGNFSSVQRMSYMGTLLFNLKRTPNIALSLGGSIIIDPSLTVPFIPIVSYYRRFPQNNLELLIDMPQRALLRRQFNKRSWATLGTEIASSVSFVDLSQYRLPASTNYSTFELKSGLTWEYEIAPKIVAGIGAGVFTTVSSRMFKATEKSNEYFVRDKTKAAPYFNISVSVLPFIRPLIK